MIGIVSQARMTSTRLPGKILKSVLGKTLFQFHIERLKKSGFPVFVATTTNQEDDVLIEFCEKLGVPYFRGSEFDVLSRFAGLAKLFGLEKVVRVTSDCPLVDGDLIRDSYLVNKDRFQWNTYMSNCIDRTYPRGFDFEIFSAESLFYMDKYASLDHEREHVTTYIRKSHPSQFEFIHIARPKDASMIRITVDEEDDFNLIQRLIVDHNADSKNVEGIIKIFEAHPSLMAINSHVEQKKA